MLYGILLIAAGTMLFFYPVLRLLDRLLFGNMREIRESEWRLLAAKMMITEYQMIEEIQTSRQQMGFDRLPYRPVIEAFKSRPWNNLRLKVKNFVRDNFGEVYWWKKS